MRRSTTSILIATAAIVSAAIRANAEEPTAQIIEYGRYSAATLGATPTTQETSGSVLLKSTTLKHLETTKTIPCTIGERFGFAVKLRGLEPGRNYTLRSVTRHPPIKQPDGRVLKKSTTGQSFTAPAAEVALRDCWCFEVGYEYELIPGQWTDTLYIDDKPLAEMTFDVGVKSEPAEAL